MNNNDIGNIDGNINPSENSSRELNGWWENKNRNITAAAVAGMIGIGALYFNVQSILITILIFVYQIFYNIETHSGNFLEKIKEITTYLKTPTLIALVISQYLFMLIPTLWIVKKWHTFKVKKYLRIKLCPIKEIVLAVLITISFIPACNYITYLLVKALNIPDIFSSIGSELFTAHSASGFIILVFVVAVTPAICEELFFRGYIQRTFERTLGMKSFLLTGFLFGLFHMQPLGLITLSLLGILFSFFFYRSKSILPSSAAHFTNNFIAIGLLYFESSSEDIRSMSEGSFPPTWIIVSLLIGAGLLFFYYIVTKDRRDDFATNLTEISEAS